MKQSRISGSWTILNLVTGNTGRVCCVIHVCGKTSSLIHLSTALQKVWPVWGAWLKVRVDVRDRAAHKEELWDDTLLIFKRFSSSCGASYTLVIRWFVLTLVMFYQRCFSCLSFRFRWEYLCVGGRRWECKRVACLCAGSLIVFVHISTFLYAHNLSGGLHTVIKDPKGGVNPPM